jgi:hypothetical protein
MGGMCRRIQNLTTHLLIDSKYSFLEIHNVMETFNKIAVLAFLKPEFGLFCELCICPPLVSLAFLDYLEFVLQLNDLWADA